MAEELPPAPPEGRRVKLPYVMAALFAFYAAVFAAMSLLEFPFSLPLLLIVFVTIALPLGIVAAGVAWGTQLALRHRIPELRWPPQVFVSVFIATTVVVSAGFIASYPEFVMEGAAERTRALEALLPTELPDGERAAVLDLTERFWRWYLTEIRDRNAQELVAGSADLDTAARLIFEAYGDDNLTVSEVTALRIALEKVTPAGPSTLPRATSDPAESGTGN